MIIPVTHNLDPIIIGTTYDPEAFEIYIDDAVKNLTDCIVELVIHDGKDNVLATLTSGAGLTINELYGTILIFLTVAQTSNYPAGNYSYYLNITEPDNGDTFRYIEGMIGVRI